MCVYVYVVCVACACVCGMCVCARVTCKAIQSAKQGSVTEKGCSSFAVGILYAFICLFFQEIFEGLGVLPKGAAFPRRGRH